MFQSERIEVVQKDRLLAVYSKNIKGVISKEKCVFAHNEELKTYYHAAFGVCMYYPLPQLYK